MTANGMSLSIFIGACEGYYIDIHVLYIFKGIQERFAVFHGSLILKGIQERFAVDGSSSPTKA
jgi:hypothetical protein